MNDMKSEQQQQQSAGKKIASMRTARKQAFLDEAEKYRAYHNMNVKCNSDRTWLYINYALDKVEWENDRKLPQEFKDSVFEICTNTRGSHMEIGIMMPSSLALTIISLCNEIYCKKHHIKPLVTQTQVGNILGMGGNMGTVSIPKLKNKLIAYLTKINKL